HEDINLVDLSQASCSYTFIEDLDQEDYLSNEYSDKEDYLLVEDSDKE
ncbi:12302_t:CDS:1, partial [Dentiscutata erythropus]